MEIEEFIEQDILIFLDDRNDKAPQRVTSAGTTLYLTHDYEKELNEAIIKNQPTTAKDVLHALKEQFDSAPPGSPDKEQLKALLTALYERFKDFLDQQHIPTESLMTTPQSAPEPDEPPLPPGHVATPTVPTIKPTVTEPKIVQPAPVPPSKPTPVEQAKPKPTPVEQAKPKPLRVEQTKPKHESPVQSIALTAALQRIDAALGKGEVTAAVEAYREAKREAILHQQPFESLMKIHAAFSSIKRAIADRAAAQVPVADPRKEMDRQLLLQLEREKRAIDTSLHHNSIRDAMQQYKRMRLLVQQISDPRMAKAAADKLERIFAIISILRKHDDERRLKARP